MLILFCKRTEKRESRSRPKRGKEKRYWKNGQGKRRKFRRKS
jgi:hypothetical protein